MIAVTAAAVVVAVAVAVAVGLTSRSDDDPVAHPVEPTEAPAETDATDAGEPSADELATADGPSVLPEPMGGQEAIDALGDDLELVAERNNTTVDELRALLLRDATLRVSQSGQLFYEDTMTPPTPGQ